MYDYLIVGTGLFGSTLANLLKEKGKSVLVLEKKSVPGGAIRSERKDNIDVHLYGPHIFHTSYEDVYQYVLQHCKLNQFINEPLACYQGKYYHMPFNMNTFVDMWGISSPEEAKKKIQTQIEESGITEPKNLEEQAILMVGRDIYEILVKGYTEKQWGRDCKELPKEIIKRLPVRYTFNNNYFNDTYQGIPVDGYDKWIENLLQGIEVKYNVDYLKEKEYFRKQAKTVVFTGMIDEYFNFSLGHLEYRTLRFETERIEKVSYQGHAVINYTERSVPYTRIAEHKFFNYRESPVTYITKEYPKEFQEGDDPLYPIRDEKNIELYRQYQELASMEKDVIFAGRLGSYKYYDMDDIIKEAMELAKKL